jgi:SAM-dependent methyltransferase
MKRPLYSQLVPYYELIEGRDWHNEIRLITSVLRGHKSESVVDLGCGTGYHVRALTKLGFNVTGVDISKQNIEFARKRAEEEKIRTRFVIDSYYHYQPDKKVDATLCLNWSIPVRDHEVKRFLDNANGILRPRGLLIVDFERRSQIVWEDVGKPIVDSWREKKQLIVRVSVGQMVSNVLCSRDVYVIYHDSSRPSIPNEASRYKAAQRRDLAQVYVDYSYVRFFSLPEIRRLARRSGFRVVKNFLLPRNRYKRNYAVLQKAS